MRRSHVLPKDERGVALVMVIWALALLSLMAASFLASARIELRRTSIGFLLAVLRKAVEDPVDVEPRVELLDPEFAPGVLAALPDWWQDRTHIQVQVIEGDSAPKDVVPTRVLHAIDEYGKLCAD